MFISTVAIFSLSALTACITSVCLWSNRRQEFANIRDWLESRCETFHIDTFSPNMRLQNGEYILVEAIRHSAPERVIVELLALGAEPNVCSLSGVPAICFAVAHGWLPVIGALVDAGADLNAMDRDGCNVAFYTDDLCLLKTLAELGGELSAQNLQGKTILFGVSSMPQAMTLMKLGVDGSLRDSLGNRASLVSDFEVFPKAGDSSFGLRLEQCELFSYDVIMLLLERGADPNRCFEVYVQKCANECLDPDIFRLLCQAGLELSSEDIHWALSGGNLEVFALLCQYSSESDFVLMRRALKLDLCENVMYVIRKNEPLSDERYLELLNDCIIDNCVNTFRALINERFVMRWTDTLIERCYQFQRGDCFIRHIRMRNPAQVDRKLRMLQEKKSVICM